MTETKEQKLQNMRHSLAHLLAAAVMELYPKTKRTIGPAIEHGFYYDFEFAQPITDADLPKIEKKMREILPTWDRFTRHELTAAQAKKEYPKNPYKAELIKEFSANGKKKVSFYKSGEYWDLCRGGHVESMKEIQPEMFKLTHIAGAYWRGDENNPMLTRIYGLAFPDRSELEAHLKLQEEALKRDHRELGRELDLFTFSDLVGPGLPLWTEKGTVIREELEKFAKQTEKDWGYQRVSTPHIAKAELFKTSGHLPYYKNDMYPGMKLDDATYYLKAMNCPITMAMVAQQLLSYRDLPLRLAEYGTVYRYERSGVLTGLLRVRGFSQNDAHIFCTEDQLENEFVQVMKLHEYYYRDVFGIKNYYIRISLRDKNKKSKFGGNDEIWEKAEKTIRTAIKKSGVPYQEAPGEASFYGPKADFQIKSVVGREETASTNQIDFIMPARFGLKYIGADGKPHPLVAIHRAPLGSHERFIGFLIEHYAGAFPLWLAPVQVAILPISDELNEYAGKIAAALDKLEIRTTVDHRSESIGKKIRDAELQKIPYMLVVGKKEREQKTVSVRGRREKDLGGMPLEKFLTKLQAEIQTKAL